MATSTIPTVDLSPFFNGGDDKAKNKAKEIIGKACSEYGFFQISNHGIPLDLMTRALKWAEVFLECPYEEKINAKPMQGAPIPAGYSKQPDHSADKNEYLLMFPPGSSFNVFPTDPPQLRYPIHVFVVYYVYRDRGVMEEMFSHFVKTGRIIESIVNECLGLPRNFLNMYNEDRSWDFMVALRYYPAPKTGCNGLSEHEDGNCFTFVIQDEAGGLEVCKDGKWIPAVPTQGTIVVNVGDVIQVLSNNKFKSATHRVVRPVGKSRFSYAFFYSLHGDKWVEPLPQFTKDIGEQPKYKGFLYKDYQALRYKNKSNPPSRPEDVIHITHYATSSHPAKWKGETKH